MKNIANKISIYGGLGNQMFQYALYLFLTNNGIKSSISFSNFLIQNHHNGFDLPRAFKIQLTIKNRILFYLLEHVNPLIRNKYVNFFLRKTIPKIQKYKLSIYKEKKEFLMDKDILNVKSSFLIGTWQSYWYLNGIRDIILKEFTFIKPNDNNNRAIIDSIQNTNSVSIHVRKGDYLNKRWNATHHVIQKADYYFRAIQYINSQVAQPFFFIFSDDINWTKEALNGIPNATYISHNTNKKNYIDMYLMSICKHNIIANSTFSWWGAWLNQNKDKIVIAPNIWINGVECSEIIPPDWKLIEV
ncbi:MAG TPA: alpha-1,2-fucosyltransferase [Prolixibacteraceae bacterium]|jgi:hypothetical protein